MHMWRTMLATAGLVLATTCSTMAQSITYDFDTGTPTLSVYQGTPLDQTSGGLTAHFTSPSDPAAFSIQSSATTGYTLSQFSGKYLMISGIQRNVLVIQFSNSVKSISLAFATTDFNQAEPPSQIQLGAFQGTSLIGTAQTLGTYGTDTMPMGTLTFDAGAQAFNNVAIVVPALPLATAGFLVDNITVTMANPDTTVTVPTVTGAITDTTNLRALLTRKINSAPVGSKPIIFSVDGVAAGTGTTGADGWASVSYTIPAGAGTRTITAQFVSDADLTGSIGSGTLNAGQYPTLTYVLDRSGSVYQTIDFRAYLFFHSTLWDNVVGKQLSLSVDGTLLGSGLTDSIGRVSLPYTIPPGAATRTLQAAWAGDAGYLASSGTGTLTVAAGQLYIWVYSRPVQRGTDNFLRAFVRRLPDMAWIPGLPITFTLDGSVLSTGTTDANGRASAVLSVPVGWALGDHPLVCSFAGDATFAAASANGVITCTP